MPDKSVGRSATSRVRDGFVNRVCNWLLNHIATKDYRDRIAALYGLGMVALRDAADEEYPEGSGPYGF